MRAPLAAILLLAGCTGAAEDEPALPGDGDGPPAAMASPVEDATPSAPPRQVACGGTEKEIFGCRVASGKRLSVCAGARGEPVTYRFGGDRLELELEGGIWASTAYSGGGEAQIAFDRAGTRYVVFSRMVRTNFKPGEPNDPAISDGVLVLRGDKVIALQQCRDPDGVPIQYDLAERTLPKSDELFTWETGRADPDE